MARTYGLGGGGLAAVGMGQQRQAVDMLGKAADDEQQRNITNERIERERVAGNQQLGGMVGAAAGASYGSALGPWGAVIGGVIGAVAGGLF